MNTTEKIVTDASESSKEDNSVDKRQQQKEQEHEHDDELEENDKKAVENNYETEEDEEEEEVVVKIKQQQNKKRKSKSKDKDKTNDKEKNKDDKKKDEIKYPDVSLGRLFQQCAKYDYLRMVIGAIFQILNGTTFALFSVFFGQLFNGFYTLTGDQLQTTINNIALAYLGIGVGSGIFTYFGNSLWAISSEHIANNIRAKFFYSLLQQEIAFFDEHSTGELTSRLSADIVLIQAGVGEKFSQIFYQLTQVVAGIIIAFIYGWKMTLVMLGASPALIIVGGLQGYLLKRATQTGQATFSKSNSVAEDALGGMRTVYSFVAEETLLGKFKGLLKEAQKEGVKKAHMASTGVGAVFLFIFLVYSLGFWYGGNLVVKGEMKPGDVLTVFFAIMLGAMSIGQAANLLPDVFKATAAAAPIFWIIDRVPLIDDNDGHGEKPGSVKGNIEFSDVSFSYPTRQQHKVLDSFNFSVKAGKTVALVGTSGSGKSTIIQLIERFYDPDQGTIKIDGVSLKDYDLKWLRQRIGLVSQEPILFAGTIEENIRFGKSNATTEEIEQAAKLANAYDFIKLQPDGFATVVGERGIQLSGGQKQRVAIARAILKDPAILLLDEATSALDTESEALVQDALEKLMKNRTTIIVAHRLTTVKNANKICVIKQGKLAEEGTHKKLVAMKGHYSKLVAKQLH